MNGVCALIMAMAAVAQGGRVTERGDTAKEWLWQSVVLAKITSVTGGKDKPYTLDLEVIATLTGALDAAKERHVSAGGWFGESFTTQHVPAPDELVVVFIQRFDNAEQPYTVPGQNIIKFMPEDAALVVVTGLDDPKFIKIVTTLGDLRKAQILENGRTVTKKTTVNPAPPRSHK